MIGEDPIKENRCCRKLPHPVDRLLAEHSLEFLVDVILIKGIKWLRSTHFRLLLNRSRWSLHQDLGSGIRSCLRLGVRQVRVQHGGLLNGQHIWRGVGLKTHKLVSLVRSATVALPVRVVRYDIVASSGESVHSRRRMISILQRELGSILILCLESELVDFWNGGTSSENAIVRNGLAGAPCHHVGVAHSQVGWTWRPGPGTTSIEWWYWTSSAILVYGTDSYSPHRHCMSARTRDRESHRGVALDSIHQATPLIGKLNLLCHRV